MKDFVLIFIKWIVHLTVAVSVRSQFLSPRHWTRLVYWLRSRTGDWEKKLIICFLIFFLKILRIFFFSQFLFTTSLGKKSLIKCFCVIQPWILFFASFGKNKKNWGVGEIGSNTEPRPTFTGSYIKRSVLSFSLPGHCLVIRFPS